MLSFTSNTKQHLDVLFCVDDLNLHASAFFNQARGQEKNYLTPLLIQKRFPQPAAGLANQDVRALLKTAILR